MIFTSYTYIAFLLAVFLLHWSVPVSWRKPLLIVASYIFYCSWRWEFGFLLLGVSFFNWSYGRWVLPRWPSLSMLLLGVAANLTPLVYYKYSSFLIQNAAIMTHWFGSDWVPPAMSILLPLGISFFSFQGIAYLVDVATGEEPLQRLSDFLLFKSFWSQLIAGPIIRLHEMRQQLETPRELDYEDLAIGCERILFGFFKKIVLADNLAPIVDLVFLSKGNANALDTVVGILGFGMQIYFDFSAYSDIAIGSARLFGYRFPENFNWPYAAHSPREFWNRWHMTLSSWIRDYVFTPLTFLSRNRPALGMMWLIVAMALCGLWHGAQWTFVVWGIWHGVLLVANQIVLRGVSPRPAGDRGNRFPRAPAGWTVDLRTCQCGLGVLPRRVAATKLVHVDQPLHAARRHPAGTCPGKQCPVCGSGLRRHDGRAIHAPGLDPLDAASGRRTPRGGDAPRGCLRVRHFERHCFGSRGQDLRLLPVLSVLMRSSAVHSSSGERLGDRWRHHATVSPQAVAVTHWVAGAEPVRWTWGDLLRGADNVAGWLAAHGVRPGQVCALMVRHHPWFYPVYLGISLSGALPAVLAYPNARTHPEKLRQGLEGMARRSGLDWVLTERELEPMVRDLMLREGSTLEGLLFPLESDVAAPTRFYPPVTPTTPADSPCLLQHSSGTTGLQKAVMLSHRAVLGHLDRYRRAIGLTADDKIVSWLPPYHDMGLIAAFHLPLACGIPLIQLDPFEWVQAPVLFLEAAARDGATLAWLPNFAYHLMAERIHEEDLEGLRFDRMRLLINCSEPVRAEAHEKFLQRFGPYGFRAEALAACYAMAETTFAVTQTIPGRPPSQLTVDRDELARGQVRLIPPGPPSRVCVSSGVPIADCAVRLVNERGEDLPDDRVGELVIHSASMFDGYRNYAEKTAEVLQDGWYSSGDYGFRHRGECYVIGRKKDLIIVAGKNIYPEDIEDAANGVFGVLPGRVVAFGVDDPELGTEQVAVVLESEHHGSPKATQVRQQVVQAGMDIGVTISEVYIVPPRWLIKSSAGKPSRGANRERVLNELRVQRRGKGDD